MSAIEKPIMGSPADDSLMMIGCIRTVHGTRSYPVSFRDVHADSRFGMTVFERMGVGAGSTVLVTSGSSEYAHFWPYQIAVAELEGCVAIAENFIFDASRSEMFMRRLPIKVAFGISDAILNGLDSMNLDVVKAFTPTDAICARDGAADRLTALGFKPWRMVSFGPAYGFVSPKGETFYDDREWLLEEADGELLISARTARALPLVRMPTGVRGTVNEEHQFTLS
ncbi:hypothetical protein J2W40_003939 [Sphingobium xenophagum]|uniref:Uncharacterized protein n=1 Tax=Sphingobium xenophagum TaxID=121428 RepID=A0ABU1X6C0_SPHXE|nr:hypothetical protein [Sphingobium xenophagum]MDR7157091.1 hypothetical protein [Sphingobium xenophagum]